MAIGGGGKRARFVVHTIARALFPTRCITQRQRRTRSGAGLAGSVPYHRNLSTHCRRMGVRAPVPQRLGSRALRADVCHRGCGGGASRTHFADRTQSPSRQRAMGVTGWFSRPARKTTRCRDSGIARRDAHQSSCTRVGRLDCQRTGVR